MRREQGAEWRQRASLLGRALQDLIFPPHCLGCRAKLVSSALPLFCPTCAGAVQILAPPGCACCGRPLPDAVAGPAHRCGACLAKPPLFSRARAIAIYDGPLAQAIQNFKYREGLAGLATFATLARQATAAAELSEPDLILPVPLHLRRLRQRGFNQALLLARAFFPAERARIVSDLLLRQRWTTPQTGMNGRERRRNLKGAFSVAPERATKIKGQSILLVDDVFTTGSTVNECAGVLLAAEAREVQVLTLARVRE